MKILQVFAGLAGVLLVGLGVSMALTNPGQDAYEQYAVEKLSTYLKDEVCSQAPTNLEFLQQNPEFLKRQCQTLVDTGRPQIQQLISQSTERQNWVVFSIYRTDLSMKPLLPGYHFETVGLLQNFYTYQANKR
ncbi:MAG TPA: hypothetical protein DDZ80_01230 [Cyanobacteria bacterium UBA8803]|nr:hypothetical protein [Cyanobacteria bacterium UBA9273]HBL57228.1 hypothetical protein [Cyanobacteria bacterium UBA8803]